MGQATILVVDDSALDRRLAGALLAKEPSFRPVYAANGREALRVIAEEHPLAVVTDLHMPEMDGLELVEAVRRHHPSIPVILMTAHGSEETAMIALRTGAASYVPKRRLAEELVTIVRDLLVLRMGRRASDPGLEPPTPSGAAPSVSRRWTIGNDVAEAASLLGELETACTLRGICDETGAMQIGVALREAIANAVFHGNLEVSSDLLEQGGGAFHELAAARRKEAPYLTRRVHVEAELSEAEVVFVVKDEGPGFDTSSLPDPTDLSNLEKPHGRGLMLIRTFMDDVTFNDRGNCIRMVKRRNAEEVPPS